MKIVKAIPPLYIKRSLGIMLLHSPMCHTAAVVLNRVFELGIFKIQKV